MKPNRRQFLKSTAATLCAVSMPASSYSQINGANSKLRVGVIGIRSRGKVLIGAVNAVPNIELVALCDVDAEILHNTQSDNGRLQRSQDYRRLLDRNDLDAIACAAPNHWHALLTIQALQSGKHVYIEKPISHNMLEGQAVVQAARKVNKIVQCGFQNRSDTGLLPFYEGLHRGDYGAVLHVHGTCHRARDPIGKLDAPLQVPNQIDYDLWLGPAADLPILRPQLHYDWHWDFNTGNGDVGNQGPHEWDLLNWALGDPVQLPDTMTAAGNRFGWNDAGNTPNVLACHGESNGVPFCFEVMDLHGGRSAPHDRGVGVIITTDQGTFIGGRGGGRFEFADGRLEEFARDPNRQKKDGTISHVANFVDAVDTNNIQLLRSECATAANSAAMAHLANISFHLAEAAEPDQLERAYSGRLAQRDMLARLRESTMLYAAANGGTTPSEPWLLGPKLTYDNAARQFVGAQASEANRLMGREYRAGFELPRV